MNMDFADAMRAATKLTQQQKLAEATRVIQGALSGLRRPALQVNKRLEFERLKDLSSISRLRSLSQKRSLSRGAWPRQAGQTVDQSCRSRRKSRRGRKTWAD